MQDSVQNKMCVVRSSLRAALVRESMDRMMRTSFQFGLWDMGIVFDLLLFQFFGVFDVPEFMHCCIHFY